jgi:hypothetical protein
VVYDAAFYDFIGNLTVGPVADGTPGVFRLFTCHGLDLATLVSRNLDWRPGSRQVFQTFFDAQVIQSNRLQYQPAVAPQSGRIYGNPESFGNLAIVLALRCSQNNAASQRDLLARAVSSDQFL